MRSVFLILTIAIGYALLRGWPDAWHPIHRVCFAVSSLVVAFAIWGRSERPTATRARPDRPPRWLDYLTVGIALLLVECAFLVFLSAAPKIGDELATDLNEVLHPEVYDDEGFETTEQEEAVVSAKGTAGMMGNWLFPGLGNRPLNKSANLRPSNRPEVYLFPKSSDDAEKLVYTQRFLRMFTLANYQDGQWSPDTIIPVAHRAEDDLITFQGEAEDTITYEVSHQANPSGQTLAVTIPDLASIKLPNLRKIAPDTFRLPPLPDDSANYRYEVTSVPRTLDQLTGPVLPGFAPSPAYRGLPEDPDLRGKIQNLADTLGPPTLSALVELKKLLNDNFTYSLKIEMPENDDPLDSFLFNTHTGYCTHFASATVMLARALGYPARMAYGWSGGRYFEGPQLFVFRAREAHAWAEIFVRNHGWVIFETTPATRSEGVASIAPDDEPTPFLDFGDEPFEAPESALSPLLRISSWLGGASMIALLVVLVIRRPSASPDERSSSATLLPDPPNYLAAFRKACALHGFPMPPGRTLRAHLEQIEAPEFTSELLDYHYAVQYGDSPREKSREKKFLSQLRHWEKGATPAS
ncbi:MAG: transglutaminase-like domain-containing protein [Akkermansiaceae bacterium]